MRITKCDLCKKEIKDKPIVVAIDTISPRVELCRGCAEPIIDFLKEKELLEEALNDREGNDK